MNLFIYLIYLRAIRQRRNYVLEKRPEAIVRKLDWQFIHGIVRGKIRIRVHAKKNEMS